MPGHEGFKKNMNQLPIFSNILDPNRSRSCHDFKALMVFEMLLWFNERDFPTPFFFVFRNQGEIF